jgi:hypothetical protein
MILHFKGHIAMNDNTAKIINLDDYIRARSLLKMEDIKDVISALRSGLRKLDDDVTGLRLKEHKTKLMEDQNDKAFKYDAVIARVANFLEDKIAETENISQKEVQQDFLKQCDKLKSESDRIKKNIDNAISKGRYNDGLDRIDGLKVIGSMVGVPVGVDKFTETFITAKDNIPHYAGEISFILGTYWAFSRQINKYGSKAFKAAAHLPKRVNSVRRSARNAAFALTFNASVVIKQSNGIEARQPERLAIRPRAAIVAKL